MGKPPAPSNWAGYLILSPNWALLGKLEELGKARGKTRSQMALGWLLSDPVITCPIIEANNVDQLDESLGAVGLRLSEEELKTLNAMREWET